MIFVGMISVFILFLIISFIKNIVPGKVKTRLAATVGTEKAGAAAEAQTLEDIERVGAAIFAWLVIRWATVMAMSGQFAISRNRN